VPVGGVVTCHIGRGVGGCEISSAFHGCSALHAVGDSYVLVTRPSPQLATVELRFQFRYAAPQPPRLLEVNPVTVWLPLDGCTARPCRAAAQGGRAMLRRP
jgi:hypothetical protein